MRDVRERPLTDAAPADRVRKLRFFAYGLAVLVIAADQVTKWLAVTGLDDGPVILIEGFLRLSLSRNPGAAFSILQGSGVALGVVALGTSAFVGYLITTVDRPLELAALGLVLGGALGNFIDRLTRGDGTLDGSVIDFIDFDFFPSFNVADSAITIGVALVIIGALLGHGRDHD